MARNLVSGWVYAVLWVAFLATSGRALAAEGYRVAPRPAWAVPVAIPLDRLDDETRIRRGVHFLLADTQIMADDETSSRLVHNAYQIANKAGLSDFSDISIDFDPSYERVILNSVAIIRDGKSIDQLKTAQIQIYQRERDLEYQSYTGRKTIHLLLRDVRVGDIVEYSFVVSGENPALKGHFAFFLQMQWNMPVDRTFRRVDWAKTGRMLHIRRIRDADAPAIVHSGAHAAYVWDKFDTTGFVADGDAPGWYEAYPGIELSDEKGWADVAKVLRALFEGAIEQSPAIREIAGRIAATHENPQDRVVAALHFVQDTIRYVAISVGQGGYQPNPASLTLRRRYGDCKDKTALLISLLRALGIEALPALVNTDTGHDLPSRLPSVYAFDHVITRATIGDRTYWLDGTISDQAGDLDHIVQPDFGSVLVLSDRTDGLTAARKQARTTPTTSIFVFFDLTAGPGHPGRLEVRTVYEGRDADRQRGQLSITSLPELQLAYLNYYSQFYADMRVLREPFVQRNDRENAVTVTELYEVRQPWQFKDGQWSASYDVGSIRSAFDRLGSVERTSPFKIGYPVYQEETITIGLPTVPDGWVQDRRSEHIANAAFSFDYSDETRGTTTTYRLVYRTTMDHVPVSALREFKTDIEHARDLTGSYNSHFSPTPHRADISKWYWLAAVIAGWGLIRAIRLGLRWMIRWLKARREPKPRPLIYQITMNTLHKM